MLRYRHLWPIIRQIPPELAHRLALWSLRMPWHYGEQVEDPFSWHGLTIRNRAGVAAGFDKNAVCLPGLERVGAGFVEVGTVLVEPWQGNQVSLRMARLLQLHGLWNRLGFTSHGLAQVQRNLARFPRERRHGMAVACNIGPHPGNLKRCTNRTEALTTAQAELLQLAEALHRHSDFLVVNLSSPNTPGLRSLLQSAELADTVVMPIIQLSRRLDQATGRSWQTPVLVKLPPEDENQELWTTESLARVVQPLLAVEACDGFVAVNTSARLAMQHFPLGKDELPGGLSGDPLREEALRVVTMLRRLIGPDRLLIGCGGVMMPEHGVGFLHAGADLVELYSGMVFAGPALVSRSAKALKESPGTEVPGLS
ncbi:MAG TPA: dihydroorotate dehydrogenase 2 [Gemmataceae bacterium]|nr:dihydroorotate dehydrogenase 2 [Gemmataceae bacterium]